MNQSTSATPITPDSLILEITANHPQTIAVFNDLNMTCPGCAISAFHTVADSAREYGLDSNELLCLLNFKIADSR
jgi:hybrid cluster-associated redox disulfide protein